MNFTEILRTIVERGGSDVFIIPGAPVSGKVDGAAQELFPGCLTPQDTSALADQAYALGGRGMKRLMETGDDDFAVSLENVGRFRCNAYREQGSLAMVCRALPLRIPDPKKCNIPDIIIELGKLKKGLVLITGAVGSGKSTTLACMIDAINRNSRGHIITIEDPVEFLHEHRGCLVSQRELERDTLGYAEALRAALRQAPDVVLVGEMRDYETIRTALTAAETGQLVLSTLHTIGAANTVDRIVDVFPAEQQQQIRVQLSMALRAVVSQQLIPSINGGREAAFEIMITTPAIANMIRENKVHQMDSVIFSGGSAGMRTMDADLLRLYKEARISEANALIYASDPEQLRRKMN